MKESMEYKGYIGSVEYSDEDACFFGRILGIRALVSYGGKDEEELQERFHVAVDDYLILCEEENLEVEKTPDDFDVEAALERLAVAV